MVLLQSRAVGFGEGIGELCFPLRLCVLQGLTRKRKAAEKPEQAFGSSTLPLALFVNDKFL